VFTRAAEIMRYTYDGWSAETSNNFGTMFEEAVLAHPPCRHGEHVGRLIWADCERQLGKQ